MLATIVVIAAALSAPLERRDIKCGAYSCYVALGALGLRVGSFVEFENKLGRPSNHGYSLQQLKDAANHAGAHAECVRCDFEALDQLTHSSVCIALLRGGHFIAIVGHDAKRVWVVDAPDFLEVPRVLVEARWPGEAVLVSKQPLPIISRTTAATSPKWWIAGALGGFLALLVAGGLWTSWRRRGVTAVILATLPLHGCNQRNAARPEPVIRIDATEKHLGSFLASQLEAPTASFHIGNIGTADLCLLECRVSCACARVIPTTTVVRPGETTELKVRLKPSAQAGAPTADITLLTNDPAHSPMVLRLTWDVVHEFTMEPAAVEFDANSGVNQTRIATIRQNAVQSLERIAAPRLKYNGRMLAASYRTIDKSGSADFGEIAISPLAAVLKSDGVENIRVRFADDRVVFNIAVRSKKRLALEATPSEIYVGLTPAGKRHVVKVLLQSATEAISGVRLALGEAWIRSRASLPSRLQIVEVEFESPAKRGVFCKTLVLESEGAVKRQATINLRGLVE